MDGSNFDPPTCPLCGWVTPDDKWFDDIAQAMWEENRTNVEHNDLAGMECGGCGAELLIRARVEVRFVVEVEG